MIAFSQRYMIVLAGFAESQFTNLFKDKSFVDDLNRKRGIVSVRVVFAGKELQNQRKETLHRKRTEG
jgi:hypothetical protein